MRHCYCYSYSTRGITSLDKRWRLQVASSFGRVTRRPPDDVVPRGELGTRDGGGDEKENGHEDKDSGGNIRRGNGDEDREIEPGILLI